MELEINRLVNLIRRDFIVHKKSINYGFIGLSILLVGLVFLKIISNDFGETSLRSSFWFRTFTFFLIGGGLMWTSIIYWEFKQPQSRLTYLTLPASHLEKMLSRMFYSLILYPVVLGLLFFLVFHLVQLLNGSVLWDTPMGGRFSTLARVYVGLHSVVFLFAIWINKYVAPKAAIISLVTALLVAFVSALLFRIVFSDLFTGLEMNGNFSIEPKQEFKDKAENGYLPFAASYLPYVGAVFLWVVSYFKLKEKEA